MESDFRRGYGDAAMQDPHSGRLGVRPAVEGDGAGRLTKAAPPLLELVAIALERNGDRVGRTGKILEEAHERIFGHVPGEEGPEATPDRPPQGQADVIDYHIRRLGDMVRRLEQLAESLLARL